MSTLTVLKEYLVGTDGYLLNDDNNGKTVMLSGAWGSGKTHFWQNEIVREQSKIIVNKRKRNKYSSSELKEGLFSILKKGKNKKACVYISLYGKDNIEDIKSQVFSKAYAQIPKEGKKDKNIDKAVEWLGYSSKIVSAVSLWGAKIDTSELTDKAKNYQDNEKLSHAEEAIKDGGIICFDDFERKSKHIDLNDLFGVISQLALEFNCKVIVILNSDVFEGEEANVFKTVKEKTVNKFFYFEPTRRELFDSIYNRKDESYKNLNDYREDIFNAIDATEELNARIYIQVLDNCLEWIDKGYLEDKKSFTVLVFMTIVSIVDNLFLPYHKSIIVTGRSMSGEKISYYSDIMKEFPKELLYLFSESPILSEYEFLQKLLDTAMNERYIANAEMRNYCKNWIEKNKNMLKVLWKYGYTLLQSCDIEQEEYNTIYKFIKTGILPKNEEEISS